MDADQLDTCYVAVVRRGSSQMNLTAYRAPGGWRWLAHDADTGNRTGDAATSPEQAKTAAEQFVRDHFCGDCSIDWQMAFVRRQAG